MNEIQKFVVVHAGARDAYQLPLSFAEVGLLKCFVTDAYRCGGSIGAITTALPQFGSRYHPGLDSARVINDSSAFIASVVEGVATRVLKSQIVIHAAQGYKDHALSRRAVREVLKDDATLFSTSYYAGPAFKSLLSRGRTGLLFQIHPEPRALRKLFEEEIELQPLARASLLAEKEMQLGEKRLDELATEGHLAERILVASSFSLLERE